MSQIFDYIIEVPVGFEEISQVRRIRLLFLLRFMIFLNIYFLQRELESRCPNFALLWVGPGVLRFKSSARPAELISRRTTHIIII